MTTLPVTTTHTLAQILLPVLEAPSLCKDKGGISVTVFLPPKEKNVCIVRK